MEKALRKKLNCFTGNETSFEVALKIERTEREKSMRENGASWDVLQDLSLFLQNIKFKMFLKYLFKKLSIKRIFFLFDRHLTSDRLWNIENTFHSGIFLSSKHVLLEKIMRKSSKIIIVTQHAIIRDSFERSQKICSNILRSTLAQQS